MQDRNHLFSYFRGFVILKVLFFVYLKDDQIINWLLEFRSSIMYLTKDFEQLISILLVSLPLTSLTSMWLGTLKTECTVSVKCVLCVSLPPTSRGCSGWIEVRQWWRSTWLSLAILYQHRLSSLDHVSAWLFLILYLVSGSLLFHFLNTSLLKYYLLRTLWGLCQHGKFWDVYWQQFWYMSIPCNDSVEASRFIAVIFFYVVICFNEILM